MVLVGSGQAQWGPTSGWMWQTNSLSGTFESCFESAPMYPVRSTRCNARLEGP